MGVSKVPLSLNEVIHSINFNLNASSGPGNVPRKRADLCPDIGEAEHRYGADAEGQGRCQRGDGSQIAKSPPRHTEKTRSYVMKSRSITEDIYVFVFPHKNHRRTYSRERRVLDKVKLVALHECLMGTSFVPCSVVDAVDKGEQSLALAFWEETELHMMPNDTDQ